MKLITLSNGQQTQVSDEDFIFLSGFNWHFDGLGYAQAWIEGRQQKLHRLIAKRMGLNCQNQIDHIDGDGLNNQRENLRAATHSQNLMNTGKQSNNTSGYKGVTWQKREQKWLARIMVNNKLHDLGYYNTKEAAAFAYKIAAKKYCGEFAN